MASIILTALNVSLQVNGVEVGSSYTMDLPNIFALPGINVSLRLKVGDTAVRLFKTTGTRTLNDFPGNNRNSHFSGWLEEGDVNVWSKISKSLMHPHKNLYIKGYMMCNQSSITIASLMLENRINCYIVN